MIEGIPVGRRGLAARGLLRGMVAGGGSWVLAWTRRVRRDPGRRGWGWGPGGGGTGTLGSRGGRGLVERYVGRALPYFMSKTKEATGRRWSEWKSRAEGAEPAGLLAVLASNNCQQLEYRYRLSQVRLTGSLPCCAVLLCCQKISLTAFISNPIFLYFFSPALFPRGM